MLSVTDPSLSSFEFRQELFENYCKSKGITLDFNKEDSYYTSHETAVSFVWFIRGLFAGLIY